ncbi:hypothetical protein F4777DRAFT_547988 [Nemania sp. FL0916]|nr:hypothetical protein F4777DRAFT_547988 [Nemania sp. FL0916]
MTTEPSSPRRRHILSSINPEIHPIESSSQDARRSPEAPSAREPRSHDENPTMGPTVEGAARQTSKFRFKSKHSRSHRSSRHGDRDREYRASAEGDNDHARDHERDHEDESASSRRRHKHRHRHRHRDDSSHHHHHHHRHKRRRTRSPSPTPPNPFDPAPLDAETAFRESLFDAMADDEGAAYWEGVYGQPIHVYSRQDSSSHGPSGELERMDDDEYAAYVRQRMWEKTHQGLLEERARRAKAREKKEADAAAAARLTREMEDSLRRGEERRVKKGWRDRWVEYARTWERWDGTLQGMAWPVKTGLREDVDAEAVREFYVLGIDPTEVGETEFLARLKDERVRWHPDKIQQRLGGTVDGAVMRRVTAIFQIVDRLWSDTRSKQLGRKSTAGT